MQFSSTADACWPCLAGPLLGAPGYAQAGPKRRHRPLAPRPGASEGTPAIWHISRAGAAALALLAVASVPSPAGADTPSVRLGPAELKPYVLLQLDEAGTFGQDQPGGQAAGFNPRRARVGVEADVANQWQLGLIWDFGGTPGSHSRLFEAEVAYTRLKPFTFAAGCSSRRSPWSMPSPRRISCSWSAPASSTSRVAWSAARAGSSSDRRGRRAADGSRRG